MTTNPEKQPESPQSPERKKRRIQKTLILNRGEIALRIFDTSVQLDKGAVVGFSTADAKSLSVRKALRLQENDPRYGVAYLGDSPARKSYQNVGVAIDFAAALNCDAVHPGYGFTAEDPQAAKAFQDAGIIWIGPSPEAMTRLGDKANARRLAQELKIPIIRGTELLKDERGARRAARRIGYPIMAKAANAGGGDGNKVIHNEGELHELLPNLIDKYSGVFLEKYISRAKHIEYQIAGGYDGQGNFQVISLGARDCTAQRKYQKVLEESPASSIPEKTDKQMEADALRIGKAVNYENLGTVEFIVDQDTGKYYFIEVNTRIQVEHPVTELRTDLNLIGVQFGIAEGESLPHIDLKNNHVIEVRIYAEKPHEDFVPDSGTIHHLKIPVGEGVRFDPACEEGDVVPKEYDKTIGKIIVEGINREEAIQKLTQALTDLEVTGVSTNKEFLLWLIRQPEFVHNNMTTTFIQDAWPSYESSRVRDVFPFLGGGDFQEKPKPRALDISKLPHNFIYERRGVQRNFFHEVEEFQRRNPEGCSFRFGIYEESGIRFALGFWDFSRSGGTMGSEEGSAVAAFLELSHREKVPAVMFTNSGGAKQPEDIIALQQMDFVVAARVYFSPPMLYNIYTGTGGGGVNASIAESADQKYMVAGSTAGFTGKGILANLLGKKIEEMTSTVQSASDHFWNRNVDLLVKTPREALERILYEQSILELGNAVRRKGLSIPPSRLETIDAIAPLFRTPDHYRFPALFGDVRHFGETILSRIRHRREIPINTEDLTNAQREELLLDPYRPTAAEFLLPEMGVFDAISPFSNLAWIRDAWQYPPIIGAYARLGDRRYLVLGQQPQRRSTVGGFEKFYTAIRPEDFRWATRKVEQAAKNSAVDEILLMADTTGGAADEKAEAGGIMNEISSFLRVIHEVDIPVDSLLLGINASGGGITFARPVNRAAEFSNAQSKVADERVMKYIMTEKWPTEQERLEFLNELVDGRPATRLRMGFIDEELMEPAGGIQTDPLGAGRMARGFLQRASIAHQGKTRVEIKKEKFERSEIAAQYATILLNRG